MASSEKHLNIIAFDVPYPPDYGGVIDIYYKIKSLSECDVKVHLHCFEYGRREREELNSICESVNYYQRKTAKSLLFNTLPYIVLSRESEELKTNLLKNDFPILMEGLHSTYLLNDPEISKREIVVRSHNVEHDYYSNLAKVESNIFKRYYFYNEAGKLKKYEPILNKVSAIAAISPNDAKYYREQFQNVHYVPAFHPNKNVTCKTGKGDFAFYHGNLSVGENNEAALYLVNRVFNDLPYKLVIAGSKPSSDLKNVINGRNNIELHEHLTPQQIHEHISEAQCNVLPTFQSTGIKLKLLSALFAGRFCIVNTPMVENTGLENLCIIADSNVDMKQQIEKAFARNFLHDEIERRQSALLQEFSNRNNAEKLVKILF